MIACKRQYMLYVNDGVLWKTTYGITLSRIIKAILCEVTAEQERSTSYMPLKRLDYISVRFDVSGKWQPNLHN